MKTSAHTRFYLVLILLLAAILRLQNLPAIEHNVDHAYPIWQALMTLDRGYFPLTAQGTSVLFANPALTGYLYLPALILARSPYSVYLLVIFLNTLGVYYTYAAGRRLFSPPIGLIAAFLMAVNPWIIEYSRTSWVQSLLPFFVPLVFWLFAPVWSGVATTPRRRFMAGCGALALMSQTYLLAFAAFAPVALLSFIYRRRVGWRILAVGALMVLIPTLVYGAALLSDSASAAAKLSEFGQGGSRLSGEAWIHTTRLVTGHEYAASRGLNAPIQDAILRFNLSEAAHYGLVAMMMGGAALLILSHIQKPSSAIVLIWCILPPLMMTYVSRPVHPFYLLLTLPAGHLLAGIGLEWLGRNLKWRMSSVLMWLGLIPFTAFALLCTLNVVRYAEESLITPGIDGLTALPVGAGSEMVRQAVLPGLHPESVVFADIDGWILNSFAGRLFEVDRDVNITQTVHYPLKGGKYLLFHSAQTPSPPQYVDSLIEIYRFRDQTWVEVYPIDTGVPGHLALQMNLPGDRGISLRAAQFEGMLTPGVKVDLRLAFEITDLPLERSQWLFAPFAHVYDGDGQRILIADGAVMPGWAWRLGEVQIKTLSLAIPKGAKAPFRVEVGLYDGVHDLSTLFSLPDGTQKSAIPLEQ